MEIRSHAELRVQGDGHLVGHAAVFGKRSVDLGGFIEIVQAGAFTDTLKDSDLRALIEHEGVAIAREANKTLVVKEDNIGLAVDIDPPDTQAGNDIRKSIERGDVDGMSFRFRVREGGQIFTEDDESGLILRTLTSVDVEEVSIVTYPAYPDTDIAKRSVQVWREAGATSLAELAQYARTRGNQQLNLRGYK